jgi:hypothetical protein
MEALNRRVLDGETEVGTVIGIVDAQYYMYTLKNSGMTSLDNSRWTKNHPGWEKKPVYYILLDTPRKNLTIEELRESFELMGYTLTQKALEKEYDSIPLINMMAMPEEAVKLLA